MPVDVIHEAGPFRGRLGFGKSIILLEDGCSEFSNIHGLGLIPFTREEKLALCFEDGRRVWEREGFILGDWGSRVQISPLRPTTLTHCPEPRRVHAELICASVVGGPRLNYRWVGLRRPRSCCRRS